MASLNRQYDNVVTAIEAWSDDRLTLHAVKAKLMEEYNKRTEFEASKNRREPEKSYKNEQKPTLSVAQKNSGIKCHNCGKVGHIRRNCPQTRVFTDLREKLNAANKEQDVFANVSDSGW